MSPDEASFNKMYGEPEPIRIADFFQNSPVILQDAAITPFFTQPQYSGIDFNRFIDQIAAKHSPAQLQLAYAFFMEKDDILGHILRAADDVDGLKLTEQADDDIAFNFFICWIFAKRLNMTAIIDLAKVFHLLLKFLLDNQILNAQAYAVLQRIGNQALIGVVNARQADEHDFNQEMMLFSQGRKQADKIFTKPNYTIDVKKAKIVLAKMNRPQSALANFSPQKPVKLKKGLDQHQLDLELKQAHRLLNDFQMAVEDELAQSDWTVYESLILQIHHNMVVNYNRRLRHWTQESLLACLINCYQENRLFDATPTFFRLFQGYLFSIEDQGAIQNGERLFMALENSYKYYVTSSANALVH
ncbi:hypothetical protein C5Z26_08350 [Lactobacillus sp. CBA3606]|uniref:hypothetical protein n=1 Tax=Lactobacillus sp. CBA3606 TaxID=2099789 RepID=UPI000CFAC087|nr:hypothetical protein [Lactobacillus sp. CBA3606]AVK64121.1 hypothetical protein C5Z26_08350 [Lactobacillus sp. CBA3606]